MNATELHRPKTLISRGFLLISTDIFSFRQDEQDLQDAFFFHGLTQIFFCYIFISIFYYPVYPVNLFFLKIM